MDKERVIELRNKLKAGKNLPLIVYIDNAFRIIDEANVLQFTKWDDDNGYLYVYGLTDNNMGRPDIGDGVSLFAVDYESIQSMEVPRMDISCLEDSIDSIGCIGDEFKKRIVNGIKSALNPNLVNYTRADINKAMMLADNNKAIDDSVDYYTGKYPQPFKETRMMAEHNKYAESIKATEKTEN